MRRIASYLVLAPALAAVGCAPNNAVVEGSWHLWLAANSSNTVENEEVPDLDAISTHFECSRTYDQDKDRWADGYIGPTTEDNWEDSKYVGNPCHATVDDDGGTPEDTSDDTYKLFPGLVDADNPTFLEGYCTQEMMAKYVHDCEPILDAEGSAYFLGEDGYYGMQGGLEGWRTEAVLTGEGDLQLGFHQKIYGEDWHFIWVIDTEFAPQVCVSNDSGGADIDFVNGMDWVEQWSIDEDGHSIYYINAGAYQTPDNGNTIWYYPSVWNSGFGYAKFIGEEFLSVQPVVLDALASVEEEYPDLDANGYPDEQEAFIEQELVDAAIDRAEWVELAGARAKDWEMEIKVEDNLWRGNDTVNSGLDGWTERNYSWVRIKDGSDIKEGGQVSGDFQIVLSGLESNSRMVIRGEFTVDDLKVDRWAYSLLQEELRSSEGGEEYCK